MKIVIDDRAYDGHGEQYYLVNGVHLRIWARADQIEYARKVIEGISKQLGSELRMGIEVLEARFCLVGSSGNPRDSVPTLTEDDLELLLIATSSFGLIGASQKFSIRARLRSKSTAGNRVETIAQAVETFLREFHAALYWHAKGIMKYGTDLEAFVAKIPLSAAGS